MGKQCWKKSKNCKIRKKIENFTTPYKNLKKYGSFSEFRTSTEKSVMLATLCAYVWMGLQTCAVLSVNGSHTVYCEPKFVGSLREHKENRICRSSFPRTGCPSLASSSWITLRTQTARSCIQSLTIRVVSHTLFNMESLSLEALLTCFESLYMNTYH